MCFPHSGGGPSAFSTWPQFFEDRFLGSTELGATVSGQKSNFNTAKNESVSAKSARRYESFVARMPKWSS